MDELRYRALLIGNNWYNDDALSDLKGPERDVAAMKAALTDNKWGLFRRDDVKALYGRPESETRREIGTFFGDSTPDDVLLLYFSGHGENSFNELFLCTVDTDTRNLRATAVGGSFITDLADHASTQRVVILLDCCNSGLFKARLDYTGLQGRGRFILTSTYGSGKSRDAADGGPSPFTRHLVRALTGAVVADDGWVRFKAVADYVCAHVRAETGQEGRTGGDHTADLALARRGGPVHATTHAGPTSTQPHRDTGTNSFTWPATPTVNEVTLALERWAATQQLVPSRPVQRIAAIRPASTLRLTVVKITEQRREDWREEAANKALPANQYVGPITDAVTPIDKDEFLWSHKSYSGWRRGSDSTAACRECVGGWIRCARCRGLGYIRLTNQTPPPTTALADQRAVCPECRGDRKVECKPCGGCGQIRKYKAGNVRRHRAETDILITQEEPARKQGPYRPIGTTKGLDRTRLPTAIQRVVDATIATQQRQLAPHVRRARIEVAFLTEFAVDFHDGAAIRHVRLVGDDLEVHLPRQELFAIRLRRLGTVVRETVRATRTRPVVAATAVAVAVVFVLLLWLLTP